MSGPTSRRAQRLVTGRYGGEMSSTKFYDLTMTSITGESVGFDGYRDQVCLIVNVASR